MRLKIIVGNLLIVLLVGVVSFLVVRSQVTDGLAESVERDLARDSVMLARSWELSGLDFLGLVGERAETASVRAVFGGLDVERRRTRAHAAANSVAQWLRDPSRRGLEPSLVAITDETGRVVARNLDPNDMWNDRLAARVPALRSALDDGTARVDVWKREGKMLQVAAAPIRNASGTVIGALVAAYDISDGLARRESEALGAEVAFLAEGEIYASSLGAGPSREALKTQLFSAQQAQTEAVLGGTGSGSTWTANIGGDQWVGSTRPLPRSAATPMGFAVLRNQTEALSLGDATLIILIFTALGALLVFVYGFVVGTSFMKPVEKIEEGVLTVINGRHDFRIDVESAEFGGLAYRINQLINVFTGVDEADEEGRVSSIPAPPASGTWVDPAFQGETASQDSPAATAPVPTAVGAPNDPVDDASIAAELEAEPVDAYYNRVFSEFVAQKSAMGENTANITVDRFRKRLEKQAEAHAKKFGCRLVRYQVEKVGTEVRLRPVMIR